MLLRCHNKSISPLQRRSMQRISAVLMLTVLTNFVSPGAANPIQVYRMVPGFARFLAGQQASAAYAAVLSAFSLLPILLAVWIAVNYLKTETDEFIRTLVVWALLWGFSVTMAGDAVLGVLSTLYSSPFPISLFNADLFLASSGIAFRLLRRGYQ
jgi:hypothetical protein